MSVIVVATIVGLTITTIAIKASGPLAFGGRRLPAPLAGVIPLLAPALLAALVVTETLGGAGRSLTVDARVAGVAAAAIGLALRLPVLAVIVLAAVATALTRALV